MVDRDLTIACYRALLGRDPESAALEALAQRSVTLEAFLGEIVRSAEFQARALIHSQARALIHSIGGYFYDAPRVEVDMTDAQRQALFQRVQTQWRALGAGEPFWSVLTDDQFRTANLDDATIARFYESGADHARLIEEACARTQTEIRYGFCVELGCGVGRITQHLARRFERVIAVDVSEGNLRHCREMLRRMDINNVDCLCLQSPTDLEKIDNFDFLYSVIALQHNPPPLQKHIIETLAAKLNPGGGFFFQAQTYHPDYSFEIDGYLASPLDTMDMHSLPMHHILHALQNQGHRVCEVVEDGWTGRLGSHTFFGLARAAKPGLLARLFA